MTLTSLTNQACVDKAEWFCRMRDFICKRNGTYDYSATGIGWTLHDSSYATDEDNPAVNDWFVMYSPGESGDEDLYFRATFKSGDMLFCGFLYWDNVGHAGAQQYNTTDNIVIADSDACNLIVNGDLDSVNCWETVNHATYDYTVFFGKLDNLPADDTVATSSAAVGTATPATITLDAVPASWEVGQKIYIRDTANIDIITILSIAGNDITADIATNFLAGCKLQGDIGYFCNSSTTQVSIYMMANRTTGAALAAYPTYVALAANADPDVLTGEHTATPMHVMGADAYYGTLPYLNFSTYTGLTAGDTFVTGDGKNYRYLKNYSSIHMMTQEA